jgi:hypothetical protein
MTDRRHKDIQNAKIRFLELQSDNGGTPCQGTPELFYPEDYEKPDMQRRARKIAIELCKECPLMEQCRELGNIIKPQWGIYGGVDFFQTK